MGFVNICAVITQPPNGIAPRDFIVSSTTRDGTASKRFHIHVEQECIYFTTVEGVDYVATSANLMFSLGDSQQCHSVEIIDDLICEPTPENFFADMLLVSGFDVNVDPDLTTVLIDDSDEEECGKWDRTASKLLHRYIYFRHVSWCK